MGRDKRGWAVGCSTEAAATRTLAEACCEPLYSFTRLACKSRSSFWLNLRPSLYREGLIREARDVWGSLSSGCGVRSGSGSLKNSQLYNIYYKKSSDSDRSGHITAKEFGQFMKRGVPAAVKTGRGAILEKKRLLAVRNVPRGSRAGEGRAVGDRAASDGAEGEGPRGREGVAAGRAAEAHRQSKLSLTACLARAEPPAPDSAHSQLAAALLSPLSPKIRQNHFHTETRRPGIIAHRHLLLSILFFFFLFLCSTSCSCTHVIASDSWSCSPDRLRRRPLSLYAYKEKKKRQSAYYIKLRGAIHSW